MTLTLLSGEMRSQAFGANVVFGIAASARPPANGNVKPIVSAGAGLQESRGGRFRAFPSQAPFVSVEEASLMAARIWL